MKKSILLAAAAIIILSFSVTALAKESEQELPRLEILGNAAVIPGDQMKYDFPVIINMSDVVEVQDFYWHISFPDDLCLEHLFTGAWTQSKPTSIFYKTNQINDFKLLDDGLDSQDGKILYLSQENLGLGANERITDLTMEFGAVRPGFQAVEHPYLIALSSADLKDGQQIQLISEAGGRTTADEWFTAQMDWFTTAVRLPKTTQPRAILF